METQTELAFQKAFQEVPHLSTKIEKYFEPKDYHGYLLCCRNFGDNQLSNRTTKQTRRKTYLSSFMSVMQRDVEEIVNELGHYNHPQAQLPRPFILKGLWGCFGHQGHLSPSQIDKNYYDEYCKHHKGTILRLLRHFYNKWNVWWRHSSNCRYLPNQIRISIIKIVRFILLFDETLTTTSHLCIGTGLCGWISTNNLYGTYGDFLSLRQLLRKDDDLKRFYTRPYITSVLLGQMDICEHFIKDIENQFTFPKELFNTMMKFKSQVQNINEARSVKITYLSEK